MVTVTVAIALTAPIGSVAAEAVALPSFVLGAVHHTLTSEHVPGRFSVDVWTPAPPPQQPLPVLYVLDGNSQFAMVTQIVTPMMFAGELPPVVIVGIGYEVENPMEIMALRSRDYFPTYTDGWAERMDAQGFPRPYDAKPGGADAFLSFVLEELKPFVEKRYPVDTTDETLVGLSAGGAFGAHVLFGNPSAFERYLIGSPALAFDEGMLFEREAAFAKANDALPATVFLSAGALEDRWEIRDETRRMVATLTSRGYEKLVFHHHEFPEETHESVLAPTMSRGLRALFGAWPVSAGAE